MPDQTSLFMRIKYGDPYEANTDIYLPQGDLLIGRPWSRHQPDIGFTSAYISKRHALLSYYQKKLEITDLNSKHGLHVNGLQIPISSPYQLRNGDTVHLAKDAAVFTIHEYYSSDTEHTIDFSKSAQLPPPAALSVDIQRREIRCRGELLPLYGKEVELLIFLFENRTRAISYDEIKNQIWPERISPTCVVADVGNEEVNALVYRLRKRLSSYGTVILNIPRFGYRLEL